MKSDVLIIPRTSFMMGVMRCTKAVMQREHRSRATTNEFIEEAHSFCCFFNMLCVARLFDGQDDFGR